jgi:hypothetical protein
VKWKTVTRGVSEVASTKECREFAYECLGWAKTAKSGKERGIFLQMADTWLRAAASLEGFSSKAPPDPKERPKSENWNGRPRKEGRAVLQSIERNARAT